MTITKHAADGFTISDIRGGYLVTKRYIGYSLKEAKGLFIEQYGEEEGE